MRVGPVTIAGMVGLSLALGSAASAATYYVDATNGSDARVGTSPSLAWQTVGKVNNAALSPGDVVLFRRGHMWSGTLDPSAVGAPGNPVTFGAYGTGPNPIVSRLILRGDFLTVEDLTIDHGKQSGDAVRVRSATNCVLRRLVVRNGVSDGIDVDRADGLLIEDTLVHHFLAGSFTNQADAHGIVATATVGLVVRGVEVHHVSGDSFQSDPARAGSNNVTIERSHFWTGPLAEEFNANWHAGERPGENAIDTKVADAQIETAARMVITIRDVVAHGWEPDGYIANRAVFNMKEKIEATFDGITVYDSQIAFRLRGTRGNANVTIRNAVIHDVETAIRAEDDLANLTVHNSTFGDGIGQRLRFAGGSGGTGSWDWRNNAFVTTKPAVAGGNSNLIVTSDDFRNSAGQDYHPAAGSTVIGSGVPLTTVTHDRDGFPRTVPYDVGAYAWISTSEPGPAAPTNLRISRR